MKIKTKVTQEIEIDVELPCFFKHHLLDRYYALYSEDKSNPYAGLIVSEKGVEGVYAGTVATSSGLNQITEQEFNEAAERVLHKIQSIFYQTVNQ